MYSEQDTWIRSRVGMIDQGENQRCESLIEDMLETFFFREQSTASAYFCLRLETTLKALRYFQTALITLCTTTVGDQPRLMVLSALSY